MNTAPPKWADRFLRWFCRPEILEETEGDIYELFFLRMESFGIKRARRRFVWDVIRSFKPSNCKKLTPQFSSVMLRNYLKIGLRNIVKFPLYSSINIVGLIFGITSFLLLLFYARHELSYDRFHPLFPDIHRVVLHLDDPNEGERTLAITPGPLKELVNSFPEVVSTTGIMRMGQLTMEIQDSSLATPLIFSERDYFIAQPNFFRVFGFELSNGNPDDVLGAPNSLVLTESTAYKYFGNQNPIGKAVFCNRLGPLTVTGIVKDPPSTSHLQFNFLLPYIGFQKEEGYARFLNSWRSLADHTYLVLKPESSPGKIGKKLTNLVGKSVPENINFLQASLQPLEDIHLGSLGIENVPDDRPGTMRYVFIFMGIALFVLLISGINYTNLATARIFRRVREIGVRKVVGASKTQVVYQFLGEAILLVGIAIIGALIVTAILLPFFEGISGQDLDTIWAEKLFLVGTVLGLLLVLGILMGGLPAWYISQVNLGYILKGKIGEEVRGIHLRSGLVVFQFVLSMVMIILTSVVFLQLRFLQHKELGFTKDQMVVIDINSQAARNNFQEMKAAFASHASVEAVSATSRVPGEWKDIRQVIVFPEGERKGDSLKTYFFAFDEDALKTFEIDLYSGSNFTGMNKKDSATILINERLAKILFQKESAVGKALWIPDRADYPFRVRGVIRDFHFQSLHVPIAPMVIGPWDNPIQAIDYFSCRIHPSGISETLEHLSEVQETFDPETPMEFHFLSEQIDRFYESEKRAGKIFAIGAILSIFIACMGLFGLAALTASQKTQEVGIRKVLGANTFQLVRLLSRTYIVQLFISFLIASPIAYFLINRWLENFSYRIDIHIGIFFFAGAISSFVALTTVWFWSFRAANTSPSITLNYE